MIYIEYADISTTLTVPVGVTAAAGDYTLTLVSTVGREEIAAEVAVTLAGTGYVSLAVNPVGLEMTEGEWEYTLTDSDGVAQASGIMSVLGDGIERKEYEKNISYEQYEVL